MNTSGITGATTAASDIIVIVVVVDAVVAQDGGRLEDQRGRLRARRQGVAQLLEGRVWGPPDLTSFSVDLDVQLGVWQDL